MLASEKHFYKHHKAIKESNLEHILPRNASSSWNEAFPDELVRKDLTEMIGNYAALDMASNSEVKNYGFKMKLKVLKKKAVTFKTLETVVQYDEWNQEAIESRTEHLANYIWNQLKLL